MSGVSAKARPMNRARSPRRSGKRSLSHSARSASAGEGSGIEAPPSPLQASVLVLNRLYVAVHVVNVRRAMGLLVGERAEVIHSEDGVFANYDFRSWVEISELRSEAKDSNDEWIRAVSFEVQVPRVVRLLEYDRLPRQRLQLSRRSVLARDDHVCQYCGRRLPPHQLSLDHVTPRSRGGTTTWENLVCACLRCNVKKGGRTPYEARMKLVRSPYKPSRSPILLLKLNNPRYESWKTWLGGPRESSQQ